MGLNGGAVECAGTATNCPAVSSAGHYGCEGGGGVQIVGGCSDGCVCV